VSTITTPDEDRPGAAAGPGGTTSWPPPSAPPYVPPSYPASPAGYDAPPPVRGVPPLPPGVTLAPVGRRIGAYFLSLLLLVVTLGIGYVVWGLLVWPRGTTPALSVLKMRCVKAGTGAKATFGTMALREIVGRILEGILSWITELVSLILFLARDDHRCLHDLVAGTVVVLDPEGRLDATP
jgi:uncharacterized RDD family membrane protein YckC